MAEAVLSGLAADILNSLAAEMEKPVGSSASQKIRSLGGAKNELLSLESTLRFIQPLLLDAEKQQWHEDQVKFSLKSLKDVLYDLQDLFDGVATEDLRRKVTSGNSKEVRVFFSKSNRLALRLKVVNKIHDLRKKLDRITNYVEKFRLELQLSGPSVANVRKTRTHSFAREEEIIGREENKKEIIAHLLDSEVSVVSIVGIGGLGKTTLARLVYNDDKVKDCFKPKLWACHGDAENFDEYVIVKEILKSAQHECQGDPEMKRDLQDIENKSTRQLQELLCKVLDGKKYLLVLDDLWNEDHGAWLDFQSLLMGGLWGSKILVTTRNRSVVRATNAKSVVHDLRGLSEDKSWDLFKKIALVDGEESLNPRLEETGRDIVRKCFGVPLAIRTIGSLLYDREENEWLRLRDHELSEIDTSGHGVMEALKVSYDHLPSLLKHCFAYCALFPKDYVFDKRTMVQLWMAQGFIESLDENDDLEEAGDRYVSYLLQRSFLEVEKLDDSTGEVEKFKMHALMHNLASKVAGDECKMISRSEGSIARVCNEGSIARGTRHVSFASQLSLLQELTSRLEATNLRTFLSLKDKRTHEQDLSPYECEGIFSKIRHCRTLALRYADFCIPPSFGNQLKHLRFLDISGNESLKMLPDSIADLLNLQTLKLSGCSSLEALPRDLIKLVNLRHLLIDGCESLSHMPCGLNHLFSLQTLSKFVVQKMDHKVPGGAGKVDELGGLNKLAGSITLENLGFLQPAPNKGHLRDKEHLRSLNLNWQVPLEQQDEKSESDELIVWENLRPPHNLTHLGIFYYTGRNPPSWLSSIHSIVQLELSGCGRWKYLPSLSELPCLRELCLFHLDELEFVQEKRDPQQSNTARPFFPSLERLSLWNCGKLKGWWGRRLLVGEEQDHVRYDSQSSLPKLLYVKIQNCQDLKSLPLLPSLIDLELCGSSKKLLEQQVVAILDYSSEAALVSTFIPLSKLKTVEFNFVSDLDHSMLETLLPFLCYLESLSFFKCSALRSLSSGMQYLSSLQHLKIDSCEELDLSSHDDEHGTQWRSLENLHTLVIAELPKLVALPEGIQYVTNLQSLSITGCENLTSWPKWIDNFSSLQHLDIIGCPGAIMGNIISKPESIEQWRRPRSRARANSGTPHQAEELEICSDDIEPSSPEYSGTVLMRGGLGLMESPEVTQWQRFTEIYLMENQLTELPEYPRCPVLLVLFLNRNYKLRTISPSFFDYMPALEILNLSRTRIKSLPESLFRLSRLKRLFLNHCELLTVLPSKIGELQQLEVLDLEGTEIMHLPKEVAKLTKLTCLEVSFCRCTNQGTKSRKGNALIPQGTISALSQLEELSIDVNPEDERWESVVEAIVDDVCGLMRLDTLKLYLPQADHLRKFECFCTSKVCRSLSHFKFIVGNHDERIMSRLPVDLELEFDYWDRSLRYVNGVGVPIDIQNMLRHTTAFFLDRHKDVTKLSDFGIENMEQVKCCIIGECNETQVIVDGTDMCDEADISEIALETCEDDRRLLGSLEYLYVYRMKSLRSIYEGLPHRGCLSHLKCLVLLSCPQLTTIFTTELVKNLDSLEELKVEDCPLVESLVRFEDPLIFKATFLPRLKKIFLFSLPGLISLSYGLRIAPNLERLSIFDCPNLRRPSTDEVSCNHLIVPKAAGVHRIELPEESPVRPSNEKDWSGGDDEKVSKERTSQKIGDSDSCLSTPDEDEESEDKDGVGSILSAKILEPVHNVSPHGSFRRRIASWQ